jgi:hypothetical protein
MYTFTYRHMKSQKILYMSWRITFQLILNTTLRTSSARCVSHLYFLSLNATLVILGATLCTPNKRTLNFILGGDGSRIRAIVVLSCRGAWEIDTDASCGDYGTCVRLCAHISWENGWGCPCYGYLILSWRIQVGSWFMAATPVQCPYPHPQRVA